MNTLSKPIFNRQDFLLGGVTLLISFLVYAWTTAPNATLLDSGEFIVAAQHFGVPHPTGYPLWTLLSWLFQLLPLGNAAWEINLFSGVCGALASGLVTALINSSLRWFFPAPASAPGLHACLSLTFGLLFAFSFSMWSQATIAEVYTLHALLIGVFMALLYAWLQRPEKLLYLVLSFFVLALAFTNHHLTIVMAPLPFLAALLVRRDIFWDLLAASLLTVLLAYLGFAILSSEILVLKTAIRFFYCVLLGFGILLWIRRLRIEWTLVAFLPLAVAVGLLPYAYMPLASSTNPPMNWAYARDPGGFFFSFNRSQYGGSLSDQSLRSLGKLMGTSPAPAPQTDGPKDPFSPESLTLFQRAQDWTGFLWIQLTRSFTPFGIIAYFAAILVILRLQDVARRTWIYLLEIGFVLAAFLQPIADTAHIDQAGWWLQMPFHTFTNLLFALICGIGGAYALAALLRKMPRLQPLVFALPALALVPYFVNGPACSQRDRWFGWEYGHDMLKDLPKDSVVFGGTDPGRFVPTYMIFGESTQEPRHKRDPDFDRRDLYIITQNGLGEPFYHKYINDHYSASRPPARNGFEKWLGRETAYPKEPLVLPTDSDVTELMKKSQEKAQADGENMGIADFQAEVAQWIWEKNKDRHEFFVEESFPMPWTYDYALPHGLVYQIAKEKLTDLPPDVVEKDMAFWRAYTAKLLADPLFLTDYDAQRSFSKLRNSLGNIYRHWKMNQEAMQAYREALALWPSSPETAMNLSGMLWGEGKFDEVLAILKAARADDPNSFPLLRLEVIASRREELEGEIRQQTDLLAHQPRSREPIEKLLELYTQAGETNLALPLAERILSDFPEDPDMMRLLINYYQLNAMAPRALAAARQLAAIEKTNADTQLLAATAELLNNNKPEFYQSARKAVELGGLPVRERLENEPLFAPLRNEEEFKALLAPAFPSKNSP